MGEEAYEETRFVTDGGTVIVRGGYGREDVWLGVSHDRNEDDDPDVNVRLGPELQRRTAAAIIEMAAGRDWAKEAVEDALRAQHDAEGQFEGMREAYKKAAQEASDAQVQRDYLFGERDRLRDALGVCLAAMERHDQRLAEAPFTLDTEGFASEREVAAEALKPGCRFEE